VPHYLETRTHKQRPFFGFIKAREGHEPEKKKKGERRKKPGDEREKQGAEHELKQKKKHRGQGEKYRRTERRLRNPEQKKNTHREGEKGREKVKESKN
jgi:hypothetical protein